MNLSKTFKPLLQFLVKVFVKSLKATHSKIIIRTQKIKKIIVKVYNGTWQTKKQK